MASDDVPPAIAALLKSPPTAAEQIVASLQDSFERLPVEFLDNFCAYVEAANGDRGEHALPNPMLRSDVCETPDGRKRRWLFFGQDAKTCGLKRTTAHKSFGLFDTHMGAELREGMFQHAFGWNNLITNEFLGTCDFDNTLQDKLRKTSTEQMTKDLNMFLTRTVRRALQAKADGNAILHAAGFGITSAALLASAGETGAINVAAIAGGNAITHVNSEPYSLSADELLGASVVVVDIYVQGQGMPLAAFTLSAAGHTSGFPGARGHNLQMFLGQVLRRHLAHIDRRVSLMLPEGADVSGAASGVESFW